MSGKSPKVVDADHDPEVNYDADGPCSVEDVDNQSPEMADALAHIFDGPNASGSYDTPGFDKFDY